MILARHAEALFWAGRQLERTEHTTRLLDVSGLNAMHYNPSRAAAEWKRMLEALGLSAAFADTGSEYNEAEVTRFLFVDTRNGGAVRATARAVRENIKTVRDRVPVELWEEANRLHLLLDSNSVETLLATEPAELYSSVRRGCQAITGVVTEAMPRDEGHAFLRIGRMLERSAMVCRLVRHRLFYDDSDIEPDVSSLLRMASSLQAYRRQHAYDDDPLTVALFLLRAPMVPRSVLSCLHQAEQRITPIERLAPGLGPARRIIGRLRSELEFGALETELQVEPAERILRIEVELAGLCEVIAVNAFDPAHSAVLTPHFVRPGLEGR